MKHAAKLTLLALLAFLTVAGAVAQDRSRTRTVRGTVVDKDENPSSTAVVFLKNLQTMAVRTYHTDSEGRYRFHGLDRNTDYEIHAEDRDRALASDKRTISSLSNRTEIVLHLKLDKKKDDR